MTTDLFLSTADRLDLALPTLRLEQVTAMGERIPIGPDRAAARVAAAERVADPALTGRWRRWCSVFGLPAPPPAAPVDVLLHPYAAVGRPHRRLAAYLHGVLAVFDAGLAVRADGPNAALLAEPWHKVCGTAAGPEAEFGPHTGRVRDALVANHGPVDQGPAWAAACCAVEDVAATSGVPFLPRHLWLAAEDAAPGRARAVWGAAVAAALADHLPAAARATLLGRSVIAHAA